MSVEVIQTYTMQYNNISYPTWGLKENKSITLKQGIKYLKSITKINHMNIQPEN